MTKESPNGLGRISRRRLCLATVAPLLSPVAFARPRDAGAAARRDPVALDRVLDQAEALAPLRTAIVARHGVVVAERGYRGHATTTPMNIKSASKSIMSALVGIAIDRRVLEGVAQRIAPLFKADLPPNPDPRLAEITVGHLLSMQAGLARTSGPNYGRWVLSRNWVRAALAQPFVDEPGGAMLYSTGSTHLLSALLTRITGRSTLALARDWLAPIEGFRIAGWQRDPQGIYFGGNQMAMSTRSLLAFGEVYRNGGRSRSGEPVLSPGWIARSWQPRTQSVFTGDDHGYGWFLRRIGGHDAAYGWGYGGQMLYVLPSLGLTVAMTSDDDAPAGETGHREDLHRLTGKIVVSLPPG